MNMISAYLHQQIFSRINHLRFMLKISIKYIAFPLLLRCCFYTIGQLPKPCFFSILKHLSQISYLTLSHKNRTMNFMMKVVCHKSHMQLYNKLPNQLVGSKFVPFIQMSYLTLQSGFLPSALGIQLRAELLFPLLPTCCQSCDLFTGSYLLPLDNVWGGNIIVVYTV